MDDTLTGVTLNINIPSVLKLKYIRDVNQILMVTPEHYDIRIAINPHMRDTSGKLKEVDRTKAFHQWQELKKAYELLGFKVVTLGANAVLPDMVYAANHALPLGNKKVLMGKMRYPSRAEEIPLFQKFYESRGFHCPHLQNVFEGMGDALWHPDRKCVFVAHGFRTDARAVSEIAALVPSTLVLELCNERFYHLDTCLSILNATTALWVPQAFAPDAQSKLRAAFPHLIDVPVEEAIHCLAANAYCPDRKHVLIEKSAVETLTLLRQNGFTGIGVDTSEFLKGGGSVFCLKMEIWD